MNLGLEGKSALVCAASKGLGRACAESLAREGVRITIVARDPAALELAAARLRGLSKAPVACISADIATAHGVARVLDAMPDPDILVTNGGGPSPGSFLEVDADDWRRAIESNMISPITLIRAVTPGMVTREFGRIVNITSAAVKMPIAGLALSNGARTGLTGAVAALARSVSRHNVTINNILPGMFDTDRQLSTLLELAQARGITLDALKQERARGLPAMRMGQPSELGDLCAFLCSAGAGYITGQNLLIDGGLFPGML